MIKVEYINHIPYDFTAEVTDYLLGVVDERISVEIKFKAEWYIQASAVQTASFNSGGYIGISDEDGEEIGNAWVNAGFLVGDIVTITGSVSNNITTGAITQFDDTGSRAFFAATTFVTESSVTTALLNGVTPMTGVTLKHNFIENDDAVSFLSPVDGNENKHTLSGLTSTSYVELNYQGVYKSNKIGTVEIKSTGNLNEFILLHKTNIHPFALAGQLFGFEIGEAPEYFNDFKCLKYIYEISLHKVLANPNYIQKSNLDSFLLGNTGWRGENFNGGVPEYTLDSIVFKDADDVVITAIDYTLVNKVEITLNSASGRFSNNNTKFTLQHGLIPTNTSEYVNTSTDMETNFIFDQNVNTVGSASVNGRGFGTDKQVFTAIQASYISATQILITANVDYSNAHKTRLGGNDRNIYIGATVQDHTLDTEASDKVNVLCYVGQVIIDNSNPESGGINTEFFSHPSVDFTGEVAAAAGQFVEDWQIGRTLFSVDTVGGALIKTVEVRIFATHATYGSFTLEQRVFDVSAVPVVAGVQVINIESERGYKMGAGNIFNITSIKRRSDLDVGTNKFYELRYPFKIRWEDYTALTGVSSQFYDPTEDQNGFNNDWSRYFSATGWTLKYKVSTVINETGVDNTISGEEDVNAYPYEAATDWTFDIKGFDFDTDTEITGNILSDAKTIIRAYHTKISGVVPDISEVSGFLGVEPTGSGGANIIREISSKHAFEADTPWISVDGNDLLKIEKVGVQFILTAVIDNVKLKALFPGIASFDVSTRIEEPPLITAKLFEDDEYFLFEDGKVYLYD